MSDADARRAIPFPDVVRRAAVGSASGGGMRFAIR